MISTAFPGLCKLLSVMGNAPARDYSASCQNDAEATEGRRGKTQSFLVHLFPPAFACNRTGDLKQH
ncbi:hypothetical protein, partial [Mesorhizobium sp. CCNWLY176]|uniref:hypothetical protein n=1 Tax=Mesorhizobium sp. CCNWLY176 TaxID=3128543 RepID=UPI00301B8B0D